MLTGGARRGSLLESNTVTQLPVERSMRYFDTSNTRMTLRVGLEPAEGPAFTDLMLLLTPGYSFQSLKSTHPINTSDHEFNSG